MKLLAVLLSLLPGLAFGVQICWTPPTENVDGTPLTDLDSYKIYWGTESRNYPNNLLLEDETLTCHTMSIAPGDYLFAMTAIDADGNESAYSNEVAKTEVAETIPLPPTVASDGDSAFIIVQSNDALVLLDVGTVNGNTSCDPNTVVRDDNGVLVYKIPVSAVTPYNASQELIVVFSKCGS